MYYPGLGRFSTRDPIEYDAGDANLYRYVRNRPTSATDPSGHIDLGGGGEPAGWCGKPRCRPGEEPPGGSWLPYSNADPMGNIAALRTMLAGFKRNGYPWAAELLGMFLDGKGGDTLYDMSKYAGKIQADPEYQEAIDRHVAALILGGERGRLPDRDPRPPTLDYAFEVEFLTPFLDFNPLGRPWKTGDDVSIAIGTGHFGYMNASLNLTPVRSTESNGWLADSYESVCKVVFRAQMIQYDDFAFWPMLHRQVNQWYHAGVEAQRAGFKSVQHFEIWEEQRVYYLHTRRNFLVGNLAARKYFWVEDSAGNRIRGYSER